MIVLDVETTGLNPLKNSIISLGALDFDTPHNTFYEECRVWQGADIEDEALAINGSLRSDIEEGSVVRGKNEKELITDFVAWVETIPERILVAQNPSFDLEFIQAACERAGIVCPFAKRTIDIHTVTWLHMTANGALPPTKNGRSAISLDTALVYVGVPEEPKPHNALTGAYAHAEVLARIAYTKKLLPQFIAYDIPWTTNP